MKSSIENIDNIPLLSKFSIDDFIIPCVECFYGFSILTELHKFFKILHHKVRWNKQ